MMRCWALLWIGLAGAVVDVPARGAAPAASQPVSRSYLIKLHRPAKVGERYFIKLNWSWSEEDQITVAGRGKEPRTKQAAQSVDLAASAQTLAVDGRGYATRTKFVLSGEGSVGLPDGTTQRLEARETLIASWNGKKLEVTCAGRALSREVAAVLGRALPGKKAPWAPTADEIYGTARRQRVGWDWDVNRKKAAASFRRLGIDVPEREVEGEARLLSVETVNGEACVRVGATLRSDKISALPLAMVSLPAGVALTEGSVHGAVTATCPVGMNGRAVSEYETVRIAMTLNGLLGVRREPTKMLRVVRESRQVQVSEGPGEGVAGVKE
jgi:hypothetical protein